MLKNKIKKHKIGARYHCPHFFILNEGLNSGKPSRQSWGNCFVFLAETKDDRDFHYFLFQGLWEFGFFGKTLLGTSVPFIRIGDLTDIAEEVLNGIDTGDRRLEDFRGVISQIERQYSSLMRQVDHTLQIRREVFYKLVKR